MSAQPMIDFILQDWDANRGSWKSCFVLACYRAAQWANRLQKPWWWLGVPVLAFYTIVVEWVMGIELNYKSTIGPGLRLYHGAGLVVHEAAVIGSNCILRHCTTIGMKNGPADCPVIGDNVDIGSNVVLIGPIRIGDGAGIGAGSVVIRDVAPGDIVVGNPARPVGKRA
jgi:putative colanic acid biosynthesis acetyltransferase WcaB